MQTPQTIYTSTAVDTVDLSVVIVNYNVKYFLEQALLSVREASKRLNVEVFVVDNNSVDGSNQLVREKFPEVKLIANKDNVGFSKANNQAMRVSKGRYVLLLNPDTLVEEDTFDKVVAFMDEHPDAGGLGVKMVDGKGIFLPESKRGLPTPEVSFYKIFGLSSLFPKSKIFGQYHLGYLDENETNEIEILAGAFMLMRKETLDKVGLLDEDFFMYGEDIDLSYRIIKGGYKNYYFPETTIIHYKGESTKKGSLNYVRIFYNAMIIFVRKHFSEGRANLFAFCINVAVYLRAAVALFSRFLQKMALPFADAAMIWGGMYLIKDFWQNNFKAAEGLVYPSIYMTFNVPLYIGIWIIATFFSGGYDKPHRFDRTVRGIIAGTLVISAVYGFLNEDYRFSRAMILLGAGWALIALVGLRALIRLVKQKSISLDDEAQQRLVIVGEEAECERVYMLLNKAGVNMNYIGIVAPQSAMEKEGPYIGHLEQLKEIVQIYKIDEIIFCAKDISSQKIIEMMTTIGSDLDYKIAPQESLSIIGSNSKNTAGDLYTVDIKLNIKESRNKRNKRVLDVAMSFFLLLLSPLLIFLLQKPMDFIKHIFQVLMGRLSWVGYQSESPAQTLNLPPIKKGVLSPLNALAEKQYSDSTIYRLNMLYAKDYHTSQDLEIIRKGWRKL